MKRPHLNLVIALNLTVAAGACGATPTSPSPQREVRAPFVPAPTPPSGPLSRSLVSQWEGSSTVESITGVVPSCIAPFWRPTSTEALSAEIFRFQEHLDMVLHQRASEECHVQVGESQGRVTGGPWPYDEVDCLLVPSLCNLGCHFRLTASDWNCEGMPPEVWIDGVFLTGSVDEESPDRIQGTMEIRYGHRPGNPTQGGGYSPLTVVAGFDMRKVSR